MLSMTVTTGYSEFQTHEMRSRMMEATRDIAMTTTHTIRSQSGAFSRTTCPHPWRAVTEQKYFSRDLNHFQNVSFLNFWATPLARSDMVDTSCCSTNLGQEEGNTEWKLVNDSLIDQYLGGN